MSRIDEFESVFKSASKPRFHHEPVTLRKGLIVTDLEGEAQAAFKQKVQAFLSVLEGFEFKAVGPEAYPSVEVLLDFVYNEQPDLIVSYRNIGIDAWKYAYSLGVYIEVLTQATEVPVLVVPSPHAPEDVQHKLQGTGAVMVVTNHLTGDDHLVSYGLHFTSNDGKLLLCHVEDEHWFRSYMDAIGKIPEIETSLAEKLIEEQLLKEPTDYIASVREVLEEEGAHPQIEAVVLKGYELGEYRRLTQERSVDLLVFNTKAEYRRAMAGLAYALAVELRHVPMLML